jgi:phosphate starvation-inducible PhoH-like protein
VSKRNHNGTNGQLKLKSIVPLTENQERVFDTFRKKNLLLHGWAGTGKTFVVLYLSLKEILEVGKYEKIYIVRSAVASRSVGYLPGDLWEKLEVFETPYVDICKELLGKHDGYAHLKTRGLVEFVSTSYLRGVTLDNCIILVDEIQNCDFGELSTVITRLGKNVKVIFCGDFRQTDFRGHEEHCRKDVHNFMDILKKMNGDFEIIEFGIEDIVRNSLVKSFLVLAGEMGLN